MTTNVRHRVRSSIAGVLLFPFLSVACFHFVLEPAGSVQVGKEVRMTLSDEGFAHLKDSIGSQFPQLHRIIEGSVVAKDERQIFIGIYIPAEGSRSHNMQQRIAIPQADIIGLERRVVDRKKTGIIAAAAAVALGVLVNHWVSGKFGGTTNPIPDQGPGENIQVPSYPGR